MNADSIFDKRRTIHAGIYALSAVITTFAFWYTATVVHDIVVLIFTKGTDKILYHVTRIF